MEAFVGQAMGPSDFGSPYVAYDSHVSHVQGHADSLRPAPSAVRVANSPGGRAQLNAVYEARDETYSVGETVHYYSESNKKWMETKVERVNAPSKAGISYDLQCKRNAQADKIKKMRPEARPGQALMREVPDPTPVVNAAMGQLAPLREKVAQAEDRHAGLYGQNLAARQVDDDPTRFSKGDKVLYWSATHQQHMPAVVQEVLSTRAYKLDVKNRADVSNMKPLPADRRLSGRGADGRELCQESCGELDVDLSRAEWSLQDPNRAAEFRPFNATTNLKACSPPAHQPPAPVPQPAGLCSKEQLRRDQIQAPAESPAPGNPPILSLFLGTGVEGRRRNSAAPAVVAPASRPSSLANSPAGSIRCSPGALGAGEGSPVSPCRHGHEGGLLASPLQARPVDGTGPPLEVGDLTFSDKFDPSLQHIQQQLGASLGLDHCAVEEMVGFKGGLNEGVWFLTSKSLDQDLVLKLVRCHRIAANILTEAENLQKLSVKHPGLATDPSLAFPIKVFSCSNQNKEKRHDLIVMKKVRGERLAELMARKVFMKEVAGLYRILERLGVGLADFHDRYGNMQHGDFQPSNVFYDEELQEMSLIDIGGMGVPTVDTDLEHFRESLRILAANYGSDVMEVGYHHFEQGYQGFRRT